MNGVSHHVRIWGDARAPKLFALHGWMDCSASFQFLVDAFASPWQVIAPDWRGFGRSQWLGRPYWFPDYLADLDALLAHYCPHEPARLVGHSMGGNILCLYAGARPERVGALASLEGIGLPPTQPDDAPGRYRKWLDQLREPRRPKVYADVVALAARLAEGNPRLTEARARFLAEHFSAAGPHGGVVAAGDPWHRVTYPVLYRLEEAKACWRAITAPVLWVSATQSSMMKMFAGHEEDLRARLACFRDLREASIEDCGHMMQHDQPEALARILEAFFRESAASGSARRGSAAASPARAA